VHPLGDLVPAEYPDADENRLQEKGDRGLDRQRRAEDVAHVPGILGPVHTELELQRDARYDAQGEVYQEEPAPKLRHLQPGLVATRYIARFEVSREDGQPDRQGNEDEMKHAGYGELPPTQGQNIHDGILYEGNAPRRAALRPRSLSVTTIPSTMLKAEKTGLRGLGIKNIYCVSFRERPLSVKQKMKEE
jgi:hypothetical protein